MVIWSWRSFWYSSVYSCHFLISSSSVRSIIISALYCVHLCMKCFLGISNLLEEISRVSHSIDFLWSYWFASYWFALITEEGFLVSPCYSLELWIQMGIFFLFSFAFSFSLSLSFFFFGQLFVRLPQTTILPFCISCSWGWSWSMPPIQCHEPLSIVLQALCLSDLIPWIYLSLPLYNCKGFYLCHTWMV